MSIVIIFLLNVVLVPAQQIDKDLINTDTLPLPTSKKNLDNVNELLSNTPKAFTENCGQLDNDYVRFYDQGGSVWFTDDGVWFELRDYTESRGRGSGFRDHGAYDPMEKFKDPEPMEYRKVILKQEFVDVNLVRPVGREKLSWNSNFFNGNDSSKWCTDVPNYGEVWFENIYNGIDLRYYTNKKGLKYDLIVKPNGKISDIRIKWNGAEKIFLNPSGDLTIQSAFGDIVDSGLYIFQNHGESRHKIEGKFEIYNNMEYGFNISSNYQSQEILIIDPGLEYATFIGGSSNDYGADVALDSKGDIIAGGSTGSSNFPTTIGTYNISQNGQYDFYVIKLNSNCSKLIFSTFMGGTSQELGGNIALDSNGNIIFAGQSWSSNYPTTTGAFKTTFNGSREGVVFKLNQNGSKLIYSTFICGGASGGTIIYDVEVDNANNAYICGGTTSTLFPTTPGAFDRSNNDTHISMTEGFVSKLNSNGSKLICSTYIGGLGRDFCFDLELDLNGSIYVNGGSTATDFPTTPGAYDRTHNGNFDFVICKFNQNLSKLIYSTYIGGNNSDCESYIAIDSFGYAYLTGNTKSSDLPTTSGSYDRTHNGNNDAFLLKLNQNGSNLIFSTFIGGSGAERGFYIKFGLNGNIIISGYTNSSNFPTTPDAYDTVYNGTKDGFLLKFNHNGSKLINSTFLGGSGEEILRTIVFTNIYEEFIVIGYSSSSDFPVTSGVYDSSHNGNRDVIIVKFSFKSIIKSPSLFLLDHEIPTDLVYSKLTPYNFRFFIRDNSSSGIMDVNLTIDPKGLNITLQWNRSTDRFLELSDPNDYILLEDTSSTRFDSTQLWIIDFNITFNWTYPHENFNDVIVGVNRNLSSFTWHNVTDMFRLENDLEFNGKLTVSTATSVVESGTWVRTRERINWTGLKVVYEGTSNKYPPDTEFDVILWDDGGNSWSDSKSSGKPIRITSYADIKADPLDIHIINITGIPPVCNTPQKLFPLKIDGNNVKFYNTKPSSHKWQTEFNTICNITCDDQNESGVNGSSIFYHISIDNGTTWGDWTYAGTIENAAILNVSTKVILPDGKNNLIQWKANDSAGNGPNTSAEYRILKDTSEVEFFNPPLHANQIYNSLTHKCSITILDITSGVNASTVEYAYKKHGDEKWSGWISAEMNFNSVKIIPEVIIEFNEGNQNYIKWRALDFAGNGPNVSEEYQIEIDISNINFQNPTPDSNYWQLNSIIKCGITCFDIGLGQVNGSAISYRISTNNGTSWNNWKSAGITENANPLNASIIVEFPESGKNLIQWRAMDTIGNGPTTSEHYRILVDSKPVEILQVYPNADIVFNTTEVPMTVLIIDNTSGVDSDSIEYSISYDDGESWLLWKKCKNGVNGRSVNVQINLSFKNGTRNRIKWRASDIAGNGPTESNIYQININTWQPPIKPEPFPKVFLLSPKNNANIFTLTAKLTWGVIYNSSESLSYDLYLGTSKLPPHYISNHLSTEFIISKDLEFSRTYFWKIIPRIGNKYGLESETWSFTIDIDYGSMFDLNLSVDPPIIEMKPGETSIVKVNVINLGKNIDKLILDYNTPHGKNIIVTILLSNTTNLAPNATDYFSVSIKLDKNVDLNDITILFELISGNGLDVGLVVKRNATLEIKILDTSASRQTKSIFDVIWNNYLFLLIIILIIIFVVFLIIKKKKRKGEEETPVNIDQVPVTPDQEPPLSNTISKDNQVQVIEIPIDAQVQVVELTNFIEPKAQEILSVPKAPTMPIPETQQNISCVPQLLPGEVEEKENIDEVDQSEGGQVTEE